MMRAKFHLKEPGAKNETLIFFAASTPDGKLKVSTGEKILPSQWDPKRQRGKNVRRFEQLNQILDFYERAFLEVCDSVLQRGEPLTLKDLKTRFLQRIGRLQNDKIVSLCDMLTKMADDPQGVAHLKGDAKQLKSGTLDLYRQTRHVVQKFETTRGRPIFLNSLSQQDISDFIHWARNYSDSETKGFRVKNGYADHTTKRHIQNILQAARIFSSLMVRQNEPIAPGLQNLLINGFKMQKPQALSALVYLTEAEIQKLYNVETISAKEQKAKSLFLLMCYTGLRLGDAARITNRNIQGRFLNAEQQKTGKRVLVTLRPEALRIVESLEASTPISKAQILMRQYLRKLADRAGIHQPVIARDNHYGKITERISRKCEEISAHTGRRSFCTNAFLSGMSTTAIRMFSGHSSEKAFLGYIRASELETAQKFQDHEFFRGGQASAEPGNDGILKRA